MYKSNGCFGVVMLGGLSSRMGSDKSELTLDGQTLAQCAIKTLKSADLIQVVVSSGHKSCGIEDEIAGIGPLGGLHAVMKHASTQNAVGFVFLPVDMPLITPTLVKMLVDAGTGSVSACQFKHWPFPCYLPNNAQVLEELEQAINENLLAVKVLLKKLNAIELETHECSQDVFLNLNTPDQWLKYQQLSCGKLAKGQ